LFFYQENYKRLSVDTNVANTTSVLKENHKDDQHKSRVKEERLLLLNPGQPINAKIIRT
jgi:outer membrane protein assembly factor BamD (BamD/ComL family)